MDVIRAFWPVILFVLTMTFAMGGYAFMIITIREHVRLLFKRTDANEKALSAFEARQNVTDERLLNLTNMHKETRDLCLSILSELRGGGHQTRRSDK